MTLDDLIELTARGQIRWSVDDDPVATVHGRTVFVGRHTVNVRTKERWETLGPADDLRRAITHQRARETAA